MAEKDINKKGKTLQISFEDFILLPLFVVLIFLSLQICYRKLKKAYGNEEYKCPNKFCIRCKGIKNKHSLLKKLNEFAAKENMEQNCSSFSRLRESISNEIIHDKNVNGIDAQSPTVLHLKDLQPKAFFHPSNSAETQTFNQEETLRNVKEEMLSVLDKDYLWSVNDVEYGHWRLFYFYNQGKIQTENCKHCPETAGLISKMKSFMNESPFGNAAFSVLSPGTKISPHHGSTNVRLRCHITLQQGGRSTLYVGKNKAEYEDGKIIVFDDSFKHHVVQEQDGLDDRIVLLIDLWHPGVTEPEKRAINFIYSLS